MKNIVLLHNYSNNQTHNYWERKKSSPFLRALKAEAMKSRSSHQEHNIFNNLFNKTTSDTTVAVWRLLRKYYYIMFLCHCQLTQKLYGRGLEIKQHDQIHVMSYIYTATSRATAVCFSQQFPHGRNYKSKSSIYIVQSSVSTGLEKVLSHHMMTAGFQIM